MRTSTERSRPTKTRFSTPRSKSSFHATATSATPASYPTIVDYLQFVLASPTPFELQITKDENRSVVAFREKQGILDARLLGEVDPQSSDRAEKTQEILTQYVQDYEESKGWGVAF